MSKRKNKQDPFAEREAKKYKNPIPSREFIIQYLLNRKVPANFRELYQELKLESGVLKSALRRRLKAMMRDNQVELLHKYYYWPKGQKLVKTKKEIQIEDQKQEIDAVVEAYSLPHQWSKEVKTQVAKIKDAIPAATINKRVDLRELPLITIDGEDAKDFDDAVFCRPVAKGGWRLYVAIADVSYYVSPETAIDNEAKLRGNSVYFPSKVVPMLPEKLSNELCSLIPDQDRLCMVCEMVINASGELTRYKFYEGIMRSHIRYTYTQVARILEDPHPALRATCIPPSAFPPPPKSPIWEGGLGGEGSPLLDLQNLYLALNKQRELRGAIDFDTVETRIVFDKKGRISRIEPVKRNIAHRIIEECMLCANVAAAKLLNKHKIPGLYRVHEGPPEDKLADLNAFLAGLGLHLSKSKNPKPADYGKLLNNIQHRPDVNIIQMILLRSLCQAVYTPNNLGHFGLAFAEYTHFTSPIRRYPDLFVHRQIKKIINNKWHLPKTKAQVTKISKQLEKLTELAYHCSVTERRADDATREIERWLKCQYMHKYLGQEYEGIISGIMRFGFFVELKGVYIDGLVHVNSLQDDYYIYDSVQCRLIGERTGNVYTLGLPVKVILARVDIDRRRIDLELVEEKRRKKKR